MDLRDGFLAGLGAYVAGFLLTVTVALAGLHPQRGIWLSTNEFGVPEYFALYGMIHLPGYGGYLRGELLVYTIATMYILVTAGFLTARRLPAAAGFKAGASILVGYLVAIVLTTVVMILTMERVTPSRVFGPVIIIGVIYPALFGGVGGFLAELA